ncbi:hypothetical protein CapIbe_010882 [Capra ibex]
MDSVTMQDAVCHDQGGRVQGYLWPCEVTRYKAGNQRQHQTLRGVSQVMGLEDLCFQYCHAITYEWNLLGKCQ